jgi:hypothetical protein
MGSHWSASHAVHTPTLRYVEKHVVLSDFNANFNDFAVTQKNDTSSSYNNTTCLLENSLFSLF